MSEQWDVIVVGGGAAGLSAALTLGRARRRVLVIDAGAPRNRFAEHAHGFLGHDGIDPAELLQRGRDEATAYGATIRLGAVEQVQDAEHGLDVILTSGESLSTRSLVVASGLTDVLPDIPGLAELWGTGVLHCPYCHGWEVREQRLAVLATSLLSLHQAELIRQWSDQVTFFTAATGDLDPAVAARLASRGVGVVNVPVSRILSEEGRLTGVVLADGDLIALDALFTAAQLMPHDEFLASLDLERADNPMGSFIAVDPAGKTSHPRIWAAGNVVSPGANVPMSVGAGSMAGGAVNGALVTEDFDLAGDHVPNTVAAHWEGQYAEQPRRWSGRVNQTMAEVVRELQHGADRTALDLGCGEGGDAVWLAEHGWQVTAVDISPTATARGAEGAAARGVADRITWVGHDLSTWATDATFDLVTASFLHSDVELDRTAILRRAADRIRPGGHLLIVSHVFESSEDMPPWALRHHHHEAADDPALQDRLSVLLSPAQEISELALDESEWQTVTAETRGRQAIGPDGRETAQVKDGVVLLRRRGGPRTSLGS